MLAVTLALFLAITVAAQEKEKIEKLAPYVPSPPEVVERMLKLAGVKAGDVVYDLGSGDGRIPITAAQKFGAKGVGVEMDDELFAKATQTVKELKLENKVRFIHGDLLKVDLSEATVVTLYLLPTSNDKVRPNLEKYLKKGARVVCHDFQVGDWKPSETFDMESDDIGRLHTLYLYRMGEQRKQP